MALVVQKLAELIREIRAVREELRRLRQALEHALESRKELTQTLEISSALAARAQGIGQAIEDR